MDVGVTEERTAVGDLSFDEWVDARVPALLRFAYLVTGSQHAAGAADHADGIATGDAVWRVCGTLPPQQRAAVVLRYYEDLEYAEIAAILGVTQATARSHVHRALTAMRAELQRQEDDDE
jgi:RNA polymerase sigma factor (sigma-70 family)